MAKIDIKYDKTKTVREMTARPILVVSDIKKSEGIRVNIWILMTVPR